MEKKAISIIALDPRAARSYGRDVEGLFGEVADVSVFSVMDGSAMGVLPHADLFAASTDAFGSPEELARHVPIDSQTMAVQASFRWQELRRLKELPAGSRVLFVNMTETMAREAIAQLEQFGITHVHWIPFYPGAELPGDVHIAVTPDEMRYVPEEIETKIDVGQRACTSGMMIEIALRLGLEHLLETEKFQTYFQSIATSNYSFDQMFARSIRLESQFHILMETLEDGVVGVNERGEVFACNRHAEEITRTSADLVMGKPASQVFPYLPFSKCLQERERLPAKIIRLNGINVSAEVVPVMRQRACIGAFAILQRFNDVEARQSQLRNQLLHKGYRAKYGFEDVIGESDAIQKAKEVLRRMAVSESPILLIGETGTGKELFAHAVHRASRRRNGPFVAINVAAFPENLLESELFGYVEGAFTGASRGGKMGFFEIAHKGTIFLDEIGDISPKLQSRLLRVIQEREIIRLGNDTVIPIDVRVICATNRDLKKEVSRGNFREDLLYRLDVLELNLPPLRKRKQDILYLADRMVRFEHERTGSRLEAITQEGRELLMRYNWPGNVREMRNFCERICILCEKTRAGAEDVLQALPGEWEHGEGADSQYAESRHAESRYAESRHADSGSGSADFPASGSHVPAEAAGRGPRLEEAQRQAVKDALELCGYHRGRTAVYLGIDKSTLWRKMKKYGIEG